MFREKEEEGPPSIGRRERNANELTLSGNIFPSVPERAGSQPHSLDHVAAIRSGR